MLDRIMQANITLDTLITLPRSIRLVLSLCVCILCFGIGYWFFIADQFDKLHLEEKKEVQYKEKLNQKLIQLAQIDEFKKQLLEVEQELENAIEQLPSNGEIPSLIDQITAKALDARLKFHVIRPMDVKNKSFYSELPIEIVVEGTYNQIGQFISGISLMPRIITVNNFTLKPTNKNARLILTLNAMTYQYLDTSEKKDKERVK